MASRTVVGTVVGLAAALALVSNGEAHAKPAQCFTTDDGHYPCDFRWLGRAGSCVITARGYPTFTV